VLDGNDWKFIIDFSSVVLTKLVIMSLSSLSCSIKCCRHYRNTTNFVGAGYFGGEIWGEDPSKFSCGHFTIFSGFISEMSSITGREANRHCITVPSTIRFRVSLSSMLLTCDEAATQKCVFCWS
jgi:hypothetical protein